MADHDRDAGSRGEEEAPRDPDPGATADTDVHPSGPGLKYGEIPPGPGTQATQEHASAAHTMPGPSGWPSSPPPPRSDSFRDFIRQKPAQIAGAGLIGLVLGAMLGGTAVAVVSNLADRHDGYDIRMAHDWGARRGFVIPERAYPLCGMGPDNVPCVAPPGKAVVPDPTQTFVVPPPRPTSTG
ncbi:hypothetical protein ACTMTI_10825 [Nonomuraea sp. H19]|uniref:hypothetical protein n=1 Tax=Nonomuraea sp. H19 TaxID=3452206 RepID=UPI003F8CB374